HLESAAQLLVGDGAGARAHTDSLLGHERDELADLPRMLLTPNPGEALSPQLAAEQRADPGAGDAKQGSFARLGRQHEAVAEDPLDRTGIDIATLRSRPPVASR